VDAKYSGDDYSGLGRDQGSIALLSPDTGRLEFEVHHGLPATVPDLQLKLGQGVTGWVAFHAKPLLCPSHRRFSLVLQSIQTSAAKWPRRWRTTTR